MRLQPPNRLLVRILHRYLDGLASIVLRLSGLLAALACTVTTLSVLVVNRLSRRATLPRKVVFVVVVVLLLGFRFIVFVGFFAFASASVVSTEFRRHLFNFD